MKVLITTDWYKPVINGVVTSVVNLKEELEKSGHEVRVLTLSPNGKQYFQEDTYYIKSFKIRVYPQARATYNFYSKYLPEIIEWKPDVIHSQCEFMSFYFARYLAGKLNIPIVHTYHTIYEDYTHYIKGGAPIKKILLYGSNRIVNSTDYIIAPTNKARSILLSYGINTPIQTIPTGIDLDKYKVRITQERRKQMLEKYGVSERERVIVSVGRLAFEKNIDEILENMKKLHEIREDVVLLIVGGGPYEQELKNTVEEMDMEEYVKFTGMVSPEEVPEYFQLGEIFVCASESEAQGLTYVEALASGLPLLCKNDDCLEDVLEEGYNGYFFSDFRSFEDGIEKLLYNNENYHIVCSNAEETANEYSKEAFGKEIAKAYSAAISNFSGRHKSKFIAKLPFKKVKLLKGRKR